MPVPLVPVTIDLIPAALARRGVRVSRRRLREALDAGAVPCRLERGRRVVAEADLDALAAYLRDHPPRPCRGGAAAVALAGGR